MKTKITVGEVEILIDGPDLTLGQIRNLLRLSADLAAGLEKTDDKSDEPRSVGFTAHLDLDAERNLEPDLSEWFEESP